MRAKAWQLHFVWAIQRNGYTVFQQQVKNVIFNSLGNKHFDTYKLWLLHSVTVTPCDCYTVWQLCSVRATQCDSYKVWLLNRVVTTHCENYKVWLLHSVTATNVIFNSVSNTHCDFYTVWQLHILTATQFPIQQSVDGVMNWLAA